MTDYINGFGILLLMLLIVPAYRKSTFMTNFYANQRTFFKKALINRSVVILICSMVLMPSVSAYAQMTTEQIDSIANKAFSTMNNTAGFAIGVVKDGKIVHVKGYGVSSVNSKEAVTADTPFGIASNSKAFTSTALAILVEQGKVNWEDKVIDYIPEFKMYDEYVTNNFNIQDLLTHRSGLGLGAGDLMIFPDGSDFTIDDVLTAFQYFEPTTPFRTKFDYDNLLYLVAGELIARVSGKSWETYVEENIFDPLGMNHTYGSISHAMKNDNPASPHFFDGQSLKVIEYPVISGNSEIKEKMNGAAGGIWASANDMCKWMLMHLNEGKYGAKMEEALFPRVQQQEMWRVHTAINKQADPRSPFKSHFSGYGLGWFLSDFNGYFKVEHSGLVAGMASEVTLIPELELGIVVLNNSEAAGSEFLNGLMGFILLDEYLKLETGINWLEMAKGMQQQRISMRDPDAEKVWNQVEANKNVKIKKENYLGIYKDDWFGKVEVFDRDGELWFKSYKSPRLNGKMVFYESNTFAIKWEYQDMKADALASFSMNEDGKAISIKMKGISRFIDFSFDFQDLDLQRVSQKP
ncbi:CubicO group peptidase, beta-lactamase class C family [Marivirga sericea]|uniref:CubicO group peptidase, beta-lactamase class C family n=1 Tax=Marivirga sericea TaxID=1028 RepID=A0A1X7K5E6_9BACT|nr:serine hydrolase [Marivirga sericea]SMG35834.1 CubicO group peptidase, beta-lactamase class C family [Marivirga sericea]